MDDFIPPCSFVRSLRFSFSTRDFIDEVLGLKDGTVPDYIVDYFDYDSVWDDMQDGNGEFASWKSYPVLTDWGFIALIPKQ